MIRGIQVRWKNKPNHWNAGTQYIQYPNELTVDCTQGSYTISAKELEQYITDRRERDIKSAAKEMLTGLSKVQDVSATMKKFNKLKRKP